MVDSFETIANSIMSSRQDIISLTEQDYDASPIVVISQQNVTLKKTITIEKSSLNANYHYWGEAGITWGQGGLVWASDSTTFSSYATNQSLISTGYNTYGINTFIASTSGLFTYLAYGTGTVADNATALGTEIGRVLTPTIFTGPNYFELQFTIDETTSNGHTLTEYGLAQGAVGNIYSTVNYAMIEKTALIFILTSLKTNFLNFGDTTWSGMRLNDGGVTKIVDVIYDDMVYLRIGDASTTYDEDLGTVASTLGTLTYSTLTKDATSYTRVFLINPLLYSTKTLTSIFDSVLSTGSNVSSYEPITGILKTLSDRYKITIKTDVIR